MTLGALLALQGWLGRTSALHPHGPQAERLFGLWRFLWIVAAVVFVLVSAAALYAALHPRRADADDDAPRRADGPGMRRAVSAAAGLTVLVLLVFLSYSFSAGRTVTRPPADAVLIRVTGHQWWWEVEYIGGSPDEQVVTANEIHVPVGRPVVAELRSPDVIHSFWVPPLVGKRDLIPGHVASVWFQADSAGLYRGQCAEYCGYQHAKMAFQVIAEPPEQFAAWLAGQRDSARTPTDSVARRGREVFLASSCILCHSIQGTPAGSRVGPDLTHLASRRTIAAGALPNTRGNLAGWILDPQRIKPGTYMPANQLTPDDLQALLAYLGSLE